MSQGTASLLPLNCFLSGIWSQQEYSLIQGEERSQRKDEADGVMKEEGEGKEGERGRDRRGKKTVVSKETGGMQSSREIEMILHIT